MKKLAILLLSLLPLSVLAHGYWLEVVGNHKVNETVTVKLFYGEYESGERLSGSYLDKMKEIKVFVQSGGFRQQLTMKQLPNYWEGSFTPPAEGTYEVTGINDERDVQDWTAHNLGIVRPLQYLKIIYQAGAAQTAQLRNAYLDLIVNKTAADNYQLQLFKKDTAFTDMKVTIMHPQGWIKTAFTDSDGKLSFNTIDPALYLIVVEWIDKVPGTFRQKKYESVRYRLDYTLNAIN